MKPTSSYSPWTELRWVFTDRSAGLRMLEVVVAISLGYIFLLDDTIFERVPSLHDLVGVPESAVGLITIGLGLVVAAAPRGWARPLALIVLGFWWLTWLLVITHGGKGLSSATGTYFGLWLGTAIETVREAHKRPRP